MTNFVRVMDGLTSNASGFAFKLDEVNIANNWNPNETDPSLMGGFNYSTDDKILRWLHRGDTLYDVIIPIDAEVIKVDDEKGVYRSNKIIVTNPRKITDELVMQLYKINSLSDKVFAQCLITLLWKNRINVVKYMIEDHVNKGNVDLIINEFENYSSDGDFNYDKLFDSAKEIYNILKEKRVK